MVRSLSLEVVCGGGREGGEGGGGRGSVVFILGMRGMVGQRQKKAPPLCPLAEGVQKKVGGTIIGDAKDWDNHLASHYMYPSVAA